jgi:hypothetical protein
MDVVDLVIWTTAWSIVAFWVGWFLGGRGSL